MRKIQIIAIGLMPGCLSGCETWDSMGKTEKGALIGGAVGGSWRAASSAIR
ncbi:MAG: hypothetical protein AB7E95_06075 [Kiritimatiellales bacterium]